MYSETHSPTTTLTINWQGGNSYRNLGVSVDLTLTLDYQKSKLPVQLTKLSQKVNPVLQKCGFYVVPAGFDRWRVSFFMVRKINSDLSSGRFQNMLPSSESHERWDIGECGMGFIFDSIIHIENRPSF